MTGLEKGRRSEGERPVSKKRLCLRTMVQWSGHRTYSTMGTCLLKDTNNCCPCPWQEGTSPQREHSTKARVASSWPPLQPPAQRWWDPQAGQRIPLPSNRPLTARASKLIGQWFNCFKVQSVKLRTMTLSGLGLSLQANQIIYFSLKKKRWGREGREMGRWQKKYKTWKKLPETQFFVPAE